MRTQEFTGKTTQEAIDMGLAAMGVTIADVHVEVLQEGAKGLFGLFGSKLARVRLTVVEEEREDDHGLSDLLDSFSLNDQPARKKSTPKREEKPEKKPEPKAEKKPEQKAEKKPEPKAAEKPEAKPEAKREELKAAEKLEIKQPEEKRERPDQPRRKPAPKNEKPKAVEDVKMPSVEPFCPKEPPVIHDEHTPAGRAQRFLMDVTEKMNVKVSVYVDDSKEDNLYIHMIGDTLGILIGRRGETLDALQYLTSLQVNKGREGYIRVTLDTENYRAKREDSLRRLAQRMANRAQKTGRKVVLEPMNPYERRVLHTALQNHPGVTTHSEGEEPNRRVVIMLKNQPERTAEPRSDKQQGDRPSRRSRRRGPRKPNAAPAVQEAATEKPAVVEKVGEEE